MRAKFHRVNLKTHRVQYKCFSNFFWATLYSAGSTLSHISRRFEISRNTVKTIIRHSKQLSSATTYTIEKRNGRKPKILPENYGHLINYVSKHSKEPSYAIAVQYRTIDGQTLPTRTIWRHAHINGIRSYVVVCEPYLSAKHVAAGLNWCLTRQQWATTQLSSVAFPDESSFTLHPTKNHLRI